MLIGRGLEQMGVLPAAAFRRAEAAFAEHAANKISHRIVLGGLIIELQFATAELERLFMTPLQHLRTGQEPEATICVWEDKSPSSELLRDPSAYRAGNMTIPRPTNMGDLPSLCSARYQTVWFDWQDWLQFYDREKLKVLLQLKDARSLPAWEFAAPLRSPFSMLLHERDMTLAHAAVVGWNGCGALLAGDGGAGKSSTALKCLVSGAEFLGDDYCVLGSVGEPQAHTIYCVSKLREDAVPLYPELTDCRQRDPLIPVEKPTYVLHPTFHFRQSIPIRAIFLPRITGQAATRIVPGDKQNALRCLADGTVGQIPGTFLSAREIVASFIHKVPCYDLLLGTDRGEVVNAVRQFLNAIRPPTFP